MSFDSKDMQGGSARSCKRQHGILTSQVLEEEVWAGYGWHWGEWGIQGSPTDLTELIFCCVTDPASEAPPPDSHPKNFPVHCQTIFSCISNPMGLSTSWPCNCNLFRTCVRRLDHDTENLGLNLLGYKSPILQLTECNELWAAQNWGKTELNSSSKTSPMPRTTQMRGSPLSKQNPQVYTEVSRNNGYLPPLVIGAIAVQQIVDTGWNLPIPDQQPQEKEGLISKKSTFASR